VSGALGRLLRVLVDDGVVDRDAALDGRVAVDDLSHSNPVGLVRVDDVPVAVVKAASEDEAAVCRLAAAAGVAPAVLPCGVLALRPVAGARPLHAVVDDATVGSLGGLLRRVHALDGPRGSAPWILDRSHFMWEWLDAGPAVAEAIGRLAGAWTPRAFLHGDVKFDNVLVGAGGELVLVDWELAGRGAPEWDLAGVIDGLLLAHCVSGGAVDAELAVRVAAPCLEAYGACDRGLLAVAGAVRLAQTSAQMAAMGGEHLAASPRVLAAATGLAEDVLDVCTP
jgi:hypothetical protein